MSFPLLATAGTLKVDKAKSRIQVDAKATGHEFTGTLSDFSAKITGDDTTLKPTGVDLTWKFADLKTSEEKRDQEMIKWLGGGAPEGSFTFTKTWTDKGKNYAMGNLKIHGITKAISFPYTTQKDGDWVTIDGTATLDYEDFGLPIIRTMAVMTVNPKLAVRFHLVGSIK
ncbi:YceI family protein [Luteolibacter soli]|uniref:YceI family protein n=1 Tax=Luteolibacter soli TaxID=3135280 RepID=A0ABU9B2Z2_9BACT